MILLFISFMVVILLSCKEDDYFALPVYCHTGAPFSLAELLRLDLLGSAVAEKLTYGR